MPTNDSIRLNYDESSLPPGPESKEGNPEDTIFGTKSSTVVSPLADGELLAQGSVLQRQGCPRHHRSPQECE